MANARSKSSGAAAAARSRRAAAARAVARARPRSKLLDAAERLLIKVGHAAVTTRLVSQEAGVNHGLVHYYYGSMEELFLAVLERFTARLIVRQRAMYAADTTFLVKWRKAMGFLEEDLAAGYPKILLELEAMGWNRPPMRKRIAAVINEWRTVLTEAFAPAMKHYGIADGPLRVEAMVALVMTFNQGIMLERLSDVSQRSRRAAAGDRPLARVTGGEGSATMRAREPDRQGFVEQRRRPHRLRGVRRRAAHGAVPAHLVDHPLAALEGAGAVLRAPHAGRHLRRPRQRPIRSPDRGRRLRESRVRRRRPRRARRGRCRPRLGGLGSRKGATWAVLLAAEHPERVRGVGLHRPEPAARARGTQARHRLQQAHHPDDDGLAQIQPTLVARRTTAASSSSSSRRCSPSRTRPSRSRIASAGASKRPPRR